MSRRFFASLSATLGWSSAAMASYAAHWHWYTLALAIFNAAWWLVQTIIAAVRA